VRDPKVYLKDILETIEAIERFIQGMDFSRSHVLRGNAFWTLCVLRLKNNGL